MNRNLAFQIGVTALSLIIAGAFLFSDLGLGMSPLTKFFIVFAGVILGFQCIPAALLFCGMVKGLFGRADVSGNELQSRS